MRADEKTHVEFAGMLGRMVNLFGGKAAREGVTSSVAVKGDRKATMNDPTGQIIDLTEEKVYDLDLKKKTYKVTTFAELRRRMEEAQKKAEENARKQEGKKEAAAPPKENEKQMEIDVDVKNTGETQDDQRLRHARADHDHHDAREGQDARAERRHGHDDRHVAGAEDRRDEGNRRLRRALRAEAVRSDDRRRVGRADGHGDGDVSDDEAGDGPDDHAKARSSTARPS